MSIAYVESSWFCTDVTSLRRERLYMQAVQVVFTWKQQLRLEATWNLSSLSGVPDLREKVAQSMQTWMFHSIL